MQAVSSLLGGQAARVAIQFADADTRETVNVRLPDGRDEEQYLFVNDDNITGTVRISHRSEASARRHARLTLAMCGAALPG